MLATGSASLWPIWIALGGLFLTVFISFGTACYKYGKLDQRVTDDGLRAGACMGRREVVESAIFKEINDATLITRKLAADIAYIRGLMDKEKASK